MYGLTKTAPIAIVFFVCLSLPISNGFGQVNLTRLFDEYKTGSITDQVSAVRGLASLVIRQQSSEDQRTEIIDFLKKEVTVEDAAVRLAVHIELLKISAAENDFELGRLALAAADDERLEVRRRMLQYFRTFFSKRYDFGKPYEDLLTRKIYDADLDIRFQSASTLHSWGITNQQILDVLIDGLQLTNFRAGITHSLVTDKANRERIIKNVSRRLFESDRQAVVYIDLLSKLTPESQSAMNQILDLYSDGSFTVRAAIVSAIGMINSEKERSIEILRKAVSDENPKVRQMSLSAMTRLQPERSELRKTLVTLLGDESTSVREQSAGYLSLFESDFDVLWKDMREQFIEQGKQNSVASVLDGLAVCGPMASKATPDVVKLLQHDSHDIRVRACWALREIAVDQDSVIAAMNQLLRDESDAGVIGAALQTLATMKPDDNFSKEYFLKHLESENDFWRLACLEGLSNYADPKVAKMVIEAAGQKNSLVGNSISAFDRAVVKLVLNTGDKAFEIASEFVSHSDPAVRGRALLVIGQSGKEETSVRKTILEGVSDSNQYVSYCAALAASHLDSVGDDILNGMFELLLDSNRQRTVNILELFGNMGAGAAPVTPRIATLTNGAFRNRFANDAKRIFVKLGKHAAPAMEELISGPLTIHKLDCISAIDEKNSEAAKVIADYIAMLKQSNKQNRNVSSQLTNRRILLSASLALAHVSDDNETLRQFIFDELKMKSKSIGLAAFRRMPETDTEILNTVIGLLPDREVIEVLAVVGATAKPAIEPLTELATSPDGELANAAKRAIWLINDDFKMAVQSVNEILHDNRFETGDIRTEQRQRMWETLRFLEERHGKQPEVKKLMERIRNGRFPNLRSFVSELVRDESE